MQSSNSETRLVVKIGYGFRVLMKQETRFTTYTAHSELKYLEFIDQCGTPEIVDEMVH